MRISDWSSDVCSSDLPGGADQPAEDAAVAVDQEARRQTLEAHRPRQRHVGIEIEVEPVEAELVEEGFGDEGPATAIGRASCRGRVCQYVWNSEVAAS